MSVRYAWRPGSRINLDAEKAGKELESIRKDEGGDLTPASVVARARSANSSLHDHFEWNDERAAEQHRLSQAGEIIRSITIDISRSNVEPAKPIRAYVSVQQEEGRSYTSTVHAMGSADLRRQVVQSAWKELLAVRRKYEGLEELARVFTAIDEAQPR